MAQRACDLGINYFDCARLYWNGRSEEAYGAVLAPFRKNIFLTSKSWRGTRKEAEADLHLSLKALKTDHLDLWQIYSVSEMKEVDQIFGAGGAIDAFEAAKKAGKWPVGCTTLGQIEDDVRVAHQLKPLAGEEMAALRARASKLAGPALEDWKPNVKTNAGG